MTLKPDKNVSKTTIAKEIVGEVVENAMEGAPNARRLRTCGVGDQLRSSEAPQSSRFGILEKKGRLTDLVKNSKQMLSKFISERQPLSSPEPEDEEIVDVIESDLQFEEPEDDFGDVQLNNTPTEEEIKRMTFPMMPASSKARGFIEKCRTLRTYPAKIKEKKWSIGSKMVHFLRKHTKKGDDDDKETTD